MKAWLKEQGRKVGAIGAAIGAVSIDFQSAILSRLSDMVCMIILGILLYPFLFKKK